MMPVRIGPGSEVMAPRPVPGGKPILKGARVLVIMPELIIVEYIEDKMRHCLPRNAIRVSLTVPAAA
jgi:hypothetical protein